MTEGDLLALSGRKRKQERELQKMEERNERKGEKGKQERIGKREA